MKHRRFSSVLVIAVILAMFLIAAPSARASHAAVMDTQIHQVSCTPGAYFAGSAVFYGISPENGQNHTINVTLTNLRTYKVTGYRYEQDEATVGNYAYQYWTILIPDGTVKGDDFRFLITVVYGNEAIARSSRVFDCWTGLVQGQTNYIFNNSFEINRGSDRYPDGYYWQNLGTNDMNTCTAAHTGKCSFRFMGDTLESSVRQAFARNGGAGERFRLSVWTRSQSAVNTNRTYRARATLYYTDGTRGYFSILPRAGTNGWTYYERSFTAQKPFNRVEISLIYGESTGTVWYDDVRLDLLGGY